MAAVGVHVELTVRLQREGTVVRMADQPTIFLLQCEFSECLARLAWELL